MEIYHSVEVVRAMLTPTKCDWKFSSVQFRCSVMSDSLRPHESQHSMGRGIQLSLGMGRGGDTSVES